MKVGFACRMVLIAVFFILVFLLFKSLDNNPAEVSQPFINKPVPAFQTVALYPKHQALTKTIFEGKVTVLHFFASWCMYCRMEHPVMMDIADSHRVQMLGVAYKDQAQSVLNWLKQYGNPYNFVMADPKGMLALSLGVYGTPETLIIDQHGIVRYRFAGPVARRDWRSSLLPMILRLKRVG